MNRYNLKPSASAQAAAKEREFQKAWFKVAEVHKIISDVFAPGPDGKAFSGGLSLNIDSFKFEANHNDFYERSDSADHFYVALSFLVVDILHQDKPSHEVVLHINLIYEASPEVLKTNILLQIQEKQERYRREHGDPDYDRAFGSIAKRNKMYSSWKEAWQSKQNKEPEWLDD